MGRGKKKNCYAGGGTTEGGIIGDGMQNLVTVQRSLYQSFSEQIDNFLNEKKTDKNIAIWGAGVRGILLGCILENKGVKNFIFVDNAKEKQGKYIGGHVIKALHEIETEKTVFLLSMEYQDSVKQMLAEEGMKEGVGYIGFSDYSFPMFMEKVTQETNASTLIIGEQCMQVVPVDEAETKTLEELLDDALNGETKVLALPCLNVNTIFSLVKTELFQNPFCRKVVFVVNLKAMNSYNHLLPRTQKKELLVYLKEYGMQKGNNELVSELNEAISEAEIRAEDFEMENKYSPRRLSTDMQGNKWDKMEDYVKRCLMESFDKSWEEWMRLTKMVEWCLKKGVQVILISEPLNLGLYDKLVGGDFRKEYTKRSARLSEFSIKNGVHYADAGLLLDEEDFLAENTPNDALYSCGRQKFAKYILDEIKAR